MNKTKFILWTMILVLLVSGVSAGSIIYKMQICGKSMLPLNKNLNCEFYNVQTASYKDVMVGNVICFNANKNLFDTTGYDYRYVCHRVIQKNIDNIITKGDANERADAPIENKNIALKVLI